MRQEVRKVDKLGFPGAGGMAHPTEGGCVVCCDSEDVPITVRKWWSRGLTLGEEDEHHEEDIDDDAYEFMHIDVVLRERWISDEPDRQVAEDGVGQTPLERETEGETSHGDVTGIGKA